MRVFGLYVRQPLYYVVQQLNTNVDTLSVVSHLFIHTILMSPDCQICGRKNQTPCISKLNHYGLCMLCNCQPSSVSRVCCHCAHNTE